VIPGWHTTIFPPYFLINLLLFITILFATITYWRIWRLSKNINRTVFFIHLAFTIPAVLYVAFPSILDHQLVDNQDPMNLPTMLISILSPYLLFIIGQTIFFVYYFRLK
jgi:hypothetical protein